MQGVIHPGGREGWHGYIRASPIPIALCKKRANYSGTVFETAYIYLHHTTWTYNRLAPIPTLPYITVVA